MCRLDARRLHCFRVIAVVSRDRAEPLPVMPAGVAPRHDHVWAAALGAHPAAGQPEEGDVQAVARSYATFGQRKPIVARREGEGGIVIAGNHQLAAARQLGWEKIAVVWVEDDDITAKAFALADNRTADLGTYDDSDLLAMLQAVHDADAELFASTAYDEGALAELIGSLQTLENAGRDTEPGEPPAEPVTNPGDLILLGEHRLLCGDSTLASDVARLMDGCLADCMWTDPPYGVDYVGKTADALTIRNDSPCDVEAIVGGAFALAITVLEPGAAVYCAHPAGAQGLIFARLFDEVFSSVRVWCGTRVRWCSATRLPLLPRGRFCMATRPARGVVDGAVRLVWRYQPDERDRRPQAARRAPRTHQQARRLIERVLPNGTPGGGRVLDLFAGSRSLKRRRPSSSNGAASSSTSSP